MLVKRSSRTFSHTLQVCGAWFDSTTHRALGDASARFPRYRFCMEGRANTHEAPRQSPAAVWVVAVVLGCVWTIGIPSEHREQQETLTPNPSPIEDGGRGETIHGFTLEEWRERMGRLNYHDPASAELVPGLIAVVQSPAVPWFTRRQAALTLGRLGPHGVAAVPVLMELLDDGDDSETSPRLVAIQALGLFGPLARDATPRLASLLADDSISYLTRLSAIETLSQVGPHHPKAIPALIARVQTVSQTDNEQELRRATIEALGIIGPAASVATPMLLRVLDDLDDSLRRETVTSLGKIGVQDDTTVEALLERFLADESPAVQEAAATALERIGPTVAAEWLVPLLAADDPETRRRAVAIFGNWKSAARVWLPQIEPLWDDPVAAVRLAALEASCHIDGRGEVVASRIAALIGEEDRPIRRQAFLLLSRLGLAAESARETLDTLANDSRPEVRNAARKALLNLRDR
jgi:HEAT repeat protein